MAGTESFTVEEVRAVYWDYFHEAGELWFNYLGTPEENAEETRKGCEGFIESLRKQRGRDYDDT
jgi:hypothetical protein